MKKKSVHIVALFFAIFVIVPSHIYAENNKLSQADFALKLCLDRNYENLGAYKKVELKDYSAFDLVTPEQNFALFDFVDKHTHFFYQENLPIHIESYPPPYNAIFQRCMEFYHSKELKKFIRKNKP